MARDATKVAQRVVMTRAAMAVVHAAVVAAVVQDVASVPVQASASALMQRANP